VSKLTFDYDFNSLSLYNGTSGVWQPAINYSPNGTTDTGSMSSWEANPLWGPTSAADANVYSVTNGVLSMAIKPTPADVNPASVDDQPFLAGELTTYPSFSQTYGYFEMNAELAAGPGFISAFWLVPTSGAWPPELDAEEVLGNAPSTLIMTTHSSDGAGGDNAFPQWTNIPDSTQGFHTYAVDWEANTITWYFDGLQVAQAPTPSDMHSPMYMLIDDMSGAPGSSTGSPTSPAQSSAMKVNFIHAYASNPYVNGANTVLGGTPTNPGSVGSTTPPVTTPSVSETGDHGSLAKTLSQTGSYTVGGDTFVLTTGNAVSVTLGTGTSQINFIGASSATLTGGSGEATVSADAGSNKFVAGSGTLVVTGGGGKDAYVFHANGGLFKLEDFSFAKGDTLTVDKALQGAMQERSDGQGGTMLTFGAGAAHGVDIHGMATMPTTSVLWA
jgi:beta-glucanase (GH16 family)